MGRVNKKKMAELAEAAENNDEQDKSNISAADDASEKTGNRSDAEDLDKDPIAENDANNDGDQADADDEEDLNEDANSVKDAEDDEAASKVNENNKKGKKRKGSDKVKKSNADKDANSDEDASVADSDDQPLNGAKKARKGGSKSTKAGAKGNKNATKKGAAKSKKEKPNKKVENDDENNDDEEENNEESAEEEYEVQDIVDEKVERGATLYLIRWKGYTKADDTWEPADTLSCPELIEKFKKKQASAPAKGKSSKSPKNAKKGKRQAAGKTTNNEEDDDPNQEWEVEKIINWAEEKGERVFRIRWKGFKASDDTWEPESNLNCKEMIEKFMERMKENENLSFKELREEPKKTKRLVNETAPRTNLHNPVGRKSKRAGGKKRIYYGDSDE